MGAELREVDTITFREPESDVECVAIVRAGGSSVTLALSRQDDGDTEVTFAPEALRRLLVALHAAAGLEP